MARQGKKAWKIGIQKKTLLDVIRCGNFESEVCWVTVVGGRTMDERSKTSKTVLQKKTLLEVV